MLVLCGEADLLTPPECSREIAALVPRATLVMVPRCGHMLMMERPEAVNAELAAWLPSVIPARAGIQSFPKEQSGTCRPPDCGSSPQ